MNFIHKNLFSAREFCSIKENSSGFSPMILLALIFISVSACNNQTSSDKRTFYDPPNIYINPSTIEEYAPEKRQFTGIPSIAVSNSGQRWAVWYAGITPAEDPNNYVVVATNNGVDDNWEEVLIIDPDGPGQIRAFDPEAWIDPNGELWVFWAQATPTEGTESLLTDGTTAGVWALKIEDPDVSKPVLIDSPIRITDGVMMCKPIVLTTGEWVLPVSMWKYEENHVRMVVSTDFGNSWSIRGGATVPDDARTFDEHMIVERRNGSLWILVRTTYGIGETISYDRGYTWSAVTPSKINHTPSRFFIYRLLSGNLLLVKHGPIDMRTKRRSHLMAFISEDDGKTWSNGLLIDERPGVSYPDGQQDIHGNIHLIYDYNRITDQQIIITTFTEEEITEASDNTIMEVFYRRKIIN